MSDLRLFLNINFISKYLNKQNKINKTHWMNSRCFDNKIKNINYFFFNFKSVSILLRIVCFNLFGSSLELDIWLFWLLLLLWPVEGVLLVVVVVELLFVLLLFTTLVGLAYVDEVFESVDLNLIVI